MSFDFLWEETIWALIAGIATAVMNRWEDKWKRKWTRPLLYGLGASAAVMLLLTSQRVLTMVTAMEQREREAASRIATADTIDRMLLQWVGDAGLSVQRHSPPGGDTFRYAVTLPDGIQVRVERLMAAKYLNISATMTNGGPLMPAERAETERQLARAMAPLHASWRLRPDSNIDVWSQLSLVDGVNRETFLERLTDVSAMTLVANAILCDVTRAPECGPFKQ